MVDRAALPSSFEFVVVAGARAKQLMRGAARRVEDGRKPITVAQREVAEGRVEKVAEAPAAPQRQEPDGN
jgi:DNA-directed RNA polymerase subunit K/omega